MSLWPAVLGGAALAACGSAWAACHPASQLFGPTITGVPASSGIALTFDDGPNPAITPLLLDTLDRHRAHATFFLIGRWVRANPSLAAETAARGHTIGNHTDTHPNTIWLPTRRIVDELIRCQEAIEKSGVPSPALTRPPWGFRGPQFNAAVERSGLKRVVMWSLMGRDWSPRGKRHLIARLQRVRGGDILVLHDGDHAADRADRRETVRALEHWLPRWRDAGLQCVALQPDLENDDQRRTRRTR
ncbi:MAG: polysaccharide deacetylase family protein [Acidobacteria bacterium]|nr:MAG: polysaccharide deacetylase family protein [Acidobacteriota bacterium]